MITNLEEGGKIKCQRYWPDSGRCSFGPFEVTLTDEQIFADYTIRKLEAQVSMLGLQLTCVVCCHCSAEGEFREATESDSVSLHSLA